MSRMIVLFSFFFLLNFPLPARTEDGDGKWLHRLVLEGTYHGKNLLLENPVDMEKGYCITSIVVNGVELDGLGGLAQIEIDLSIFGFKTGDKIDLIIEHDATCVPTVLNPGVLR